MSPPLSSPRKCSCCKELFLPSPCKRATQRFCAKPECRKASKAHSQRKWTGKNPDYFKGAEHVERVRRWRARNPGRSRGGKRQKRSSALQDSVPTQTASQEPLAKAAQSAPSDLFQREPAPGSCNGALLQDLASQQVALLVGVVSLISGDALQENFATLARELVERGRRVLACGQGGFESGHAA